MADFITGTLVENKASGIDPGAPGPPAERFLKVATNDGKMITIFDSGITTAMPISGSVPLGESYHFLVSLMMDNLERRPLAPTPLPWTGSAGVEVWEGVVIDNSWQAPQEEYLCAFTGIEGATWTLIETPLGLAVASVTSLKRMILQPGEHLRWRQRRFDLLAIW